MIRYPMCPDQPAQIDCRNVFCKYHKNGSCTNISPAITLNPLVHNVSRDTGAMGATCWSYEHKDSTTSKLEDNGIR